MKRILIILLMVTVAAGSLAAQYDRVQPNKPYSTLGASPGYITINELNFGFGLGDTKPAYSKYFMGFTTTHGYFINKNFVTGAGTGVSFYNGGWMLPLFLDFRYSFYINKFTPYVYGDGGMLLNFDDFNGGTRLFINPGVGVRFAFSNILGATLSAGYWQQQGGTSRDSFVNIKLGIVYKPR